MRPFSDIIANQIIPKAPGFSAEDVVVVVVVVDAADCVCVCTWRGKVMKQVCICMCMHECMFVCIYRAEGCGLNTKT